jgi:LysM repeat protein
MQMRRKTVILLGVFAVFISACNLSTMPDSLGADGTATAIIKAITQLSGTLQTTPTLANTPTSTATLDPFWQNTTPPAVPTYFIPTPGPRPAYYVLQAGEYPWCIARRFNVAPKELLRVNNLSSGWIYNIGLSLTIPQGTGGFPSPRALHPHPTTYTVPQSNMTVNAVACYFGDVDPLAIMQYNNLTSPILYFGMTLQIP